jgi:hypothetical protein
MDFNVRYKMQEIKQYIIDAVDRKQRLLSKPLIMDMNKAKKLVKALSLSKIPEKNITNDERF